MSDQPDSSVSEAASEAEDTPDGEVEVEVEEHGENLLGKRRRSAGKQGGGASPAKAGDRSGIRLSLFGLTDVGQIREHNEDHFIIANLTTGERLCDLAETKSVEVEVGGVVLAVCDGMGGAAAGEVASQLAADIVYERMAASAGHRDRDSLGVDVIEALEEAGQRILAESQSNRACRGMGTTATVAALVDDHLMLGQVGDSRAYILRDDRLVQVTRDQSLVNQLIEAGQLTEEEAEHFEHSNIILQALGTADAVQVDLTYVALRRGDVLLMCSDGLSGMIRDYDISDGLLKHSDPATACRELIDEANQAGGHDNITIIVATFDGPALPEATAADVEKLRYQKYRLPRGINARIGRTIPLPILRDFTADDDTPYIEITGEFEVDPDTNWVDQLFETSPQIPKEDGPSWSTMVIWLLVIGLLIAIYVFYVRD